MLKKLILRSHDDDDDDDGSANLPTRQPTALALLANPGTEAGAYEVRRVQLLDLARKVQSLAEPAELFGHVLRVARLRAVQDECGSVAIAHGGGARKGGGVFQQHSRFSRMRISWCPADDNGEPLNTGVRIFYQWLRMVWACGS